MFNSLSERLDKVFKSLKGDSKLTELNVAAAIKDIRRALVSADVNYKIAKAFVDEVKKEALGKRNVLASVRPGELMVDIVHKELAKLLGGQKAGIRIAGKPGIVLVAGLQGSGKTTFTGKLARFLKNKGKRILVSACDVYRPAAIDQLTILAESVGVEIYKEPENKNPVEIAKNAVAHARSRGIDLVIVDTAGRLAVDEQMMDEIERVKNAVEPTETLFVVDSMTGQDAINTAKAFHKRINYDGIVLTKLDGDTRGGAALSIKYTVGKPIKFVSMGEKMEALDEFYPERMAGRILGMGDILSLVDKARKVFDEKQSKALEKKIRQNKFDFNDFLQQLNQIKKMGNVKNLISMIPGIGKAAKDIDINENDSKRLEAIILSMTPEERSNPGLLNSSRKKRIARGSGNGVDEVNHFLRQFEKMRKMMHRMSKQGKKGMKLPDLPGGFPNLMQ